MIRRLVDWCVPDKALRLGTRRSFLAARSFTASDIAGAFVNLGATATAAGMSLMRFREGFLTPAQGTTPGSPPAPSPRARQVEARNPPGQCERARPQTMRCC